MTLTEHLPTYSFSDLNFVHEYGGGEVLSPPARSEASDSESESSPLWILREDEPRMVAPAASDPIPETTDPNPITDVAAMD